MNIIPSFEGMGIDEVNEISKTNDNQSLELAQIDEVDGRGGELLRLELFEWSKYDL